ncbi:unnamed protein product [Symbiodinium necroappetens]|uniref:Carboxymuconolactone decarboxylase-like domain-containing protein n=1 Tax=Symbiodinium necroappetens TaxID=1628268 RepID=A0A812QEW8_9DINO|nr:unnamed protein product [Symbiodinium necroappetens]
MVDFTLHTPETAPDGASERLAAAQKSLGFVPSLWAIQAEAPALLEGYQTLAAIFDKTSFTATERQTVMITVNFDNECTFCMAAHTGIAKSQGVPDDVIEALRNDTPLPDAKLEALRRFTRAVVTTRGWVEDSDVEAFLAAGYGRQQVLEVILGVGLKVLSNYTNHVADTPLNEAFQTFAWTKPSAQAAE